MATSKTPPAEAQEPPEDAAPPAAEEAPPSAPKVVTAEYLDETPRTYLWPDGPQTVERGDVVTLPDGFQDDGRWSQTSKKPTRLRDNHPNQAAITSAAQSKARTELHAALAKKQAAPAAGQE